MKLLFFILLSCNIFAQNNSFWIEVGTKPSLGFVYLQEYGIIRTELSMGIDDVGFTSLMKISGNISIKKWNLLFSPMTSAYLRWQYEDVKNGYVLKKIHPIETIIEYSPKTWQFQLRYWIWQDYPTLLIRKKLN